MFTLYVTTKKQGERFITVVLIAPTGHLFSSMDYLPLFPLNIVAYPGEAVNLHIFEPRYRQMINECADNGTSFGIPVFLNNTLPGYGTEMAVTAVANRYEDGRLDIKTLGKRIFRIIDFINPAPGKLYAHGEVAFYPTPYHNPPAMAELVEALKRLYRLLEQEPSFDLARPQPLSYQVGHTVGLSLEGEYELLTLETETARQIYLLSHLKQLLPTLENIERTKARIRMNGHFREFDPLNF